jgi:N-acetylmuramoyl-L-alanine amidase
VEPTDAVLGILGDLAMSEHMMESNEFARIAQETLAERSAARSRGVKQAPFAVLMGVQMPATLVEIGFLSNEQDERALARDDRRGRIADALARSIVRFAERYDARRGVTDAPPAVASGGER